MLHLQRLRGVGLGHALACATDVTGNYRTTIVWLSRSVFCVLCVVCIVCMLRCVDSGEESERDGAIGQSH